MNCRMATQLNWSRKACEIPSHGNVDGAIEDAPRLQPEET